MVIDTSALLAIFLAEPERKQFLNLIIQADTRHISAANVLETGIVLQTRRGEAAGRELISFCITRDSRLCQWIRSTPLSPESRGENTAKGAIAPV